MFKRNYKETLVESNRLLLFYFFFDKNNTTYKYLMTYDGVPYAEASIGHHAVGHHAALFAFEFGDHLSRILPMHSTRQRNVTLAGPYIKKIQ